MRWLETWGSWEWAGTGDAQQRLMQHATSLQAQGYAAREVTLSELQQAIPALRAQAVKRHHLAFPDGIRAASGTLSGAFMA